ncbi:MAG: EVE domain-containing protein [Thermoleophilaceae bacterium]
MSDAPVTNWILTGSVENFRASRDIGFELVGLKERRRRLAEQVEPGDRVIFYLTKIKAFGAIARIAGGLFEDRTPVWPGKPGQADAYPWRFPAEPELVLPEADLVPAEELAGELEHVRKWPAEHWTLAFQGQFRAVSAGDAGVIEERMRAAVPAGAA